MTVMCAWCGKILRITTDNTDIISHGICHKCSADVLRAARGAKR